LELARSRLADLFKQLSRFDDFVEGRTATVVSERDGEGNGIEKKTVLRRNEEDMEEASSRQDVDAIAEFVQGDLEDNSSSSLVEILLPHSGSWEEGRAGTPTLVSDSVLIQEPRNFSLMYMIRQHKRFVCLLLLFVIVISSVFALVVFYRSPSMSLKPGSFTYLTTHQDLIANQTFTVKNPNYFRITLKKATIIMYYKARYNGKWYQMDDAFDHIDPLLHVGMRTEKTFNDQISHRIRSPRVAGSVLMQCVNSGELDLALRGTTTYEFLWLEFQDAFGPEFLLSNCTVYA